ncbi:ubiquinol-cytochrome-c reductase complex subunit 6 [Coprinellus micaceus]|uniref:Cytochrome b-c1 complex subunit 7 n=1 Tax=Coprinellus micaceus TaxID=71717 RepID=A0A4Y7TQM4_COPMI|nr:ubiquinol-cytochrome-c reductase complex subunit 6 [Coprinellus micaceus]
MVFGPLSVSLAPYIQSSKTLSKWVTPVANWYANASRYRQYGFKYDDLVMEETPSVQRALDRLTLRETYDRAYRLKRASQASVLHKPLEKDQWTKSEEDVRYLTPHISNVVAEDAERQKWDTILVKKN